MSNERIYPRLTNEEKKHVLDQFRKIVESGDIGPTILLDEVPYLNELMAHRHQTQKSGEPKLSA